MASTAASSQLTAGTPGALGYDMKLEVVTLPVSDVDRAKRFYQSLGWRLDADLVIGDIRAVQFTPPYSNASVTVGKGLTTAPPGSAQRLELVVDDIDAARADLISRGVEVSEPFHRGESGLAPGPDPQRRSATGLRAARQARLSAQWEGRERSSSFTLPLQGRGIACGML